jgi:chemotaxis protein MotB
MKNLTVVVLGVLLTAAIISGFFYYGKYLDMEDTLRLGNKKVLDLSEKVAQLNKERSKLYDQIKKNAERLGELESAKVRISQLEDAIKAKDQALYDQTKKDAEDLKQLEGAELRISQLEDAIKAKDQALSGLDEKISKLEEGSKEEKKIGESLRKELSSMDGMVAGLEEKLQMEKSMAKTKIEELKSTYDSLASELKRQLKSKEMTIKGFEEKLSITFVDRVLFDSGQATTTAEGRRILTRVGEILKNVHGMQIRVVGHTDNRPIRKEYQHKFPSNWELSSARAAAIVRYFQRESGLDPKSLEIAGRSFYRPTASNETEEGRAQNRRVEVIIAPDLQK